MSKYIDCPECEGKKTMVYSCCTGEPLSGPWEDIMLCPVCKEHLGEEDCGTCGGSGRVLDEELPEEYAGDDHDCFDNERKNEAWDDLGNTLREMGEEEPGW